MSEAVETKAAEDSGAPAVAAVAAPVVAEATNTEESAVNPAPVTATEEKAGEAATPAAEVAPEAPKEEEEVKPEAAAVTETNPVTAGDVAPVTAETPAPAPANPAAAPDVEMKDVEETKPPEVAPAAEEKPPVIPPAEAPVALEKPPPAMNPEQVKAAIGDYLVSPNAAPPSGPKDRDVIFGEGAEGHQSNLLLQDLIALHRLIWEISQESLPKEEAEVAGLTERLFQLMKKGKGRDLAGMKDVPRSFLVGSGRFMRTENEEWQELSDEEAKKAMRGIVFSKMQEGAVSADPSAALKDLKQEFHDFLIAQGTVAETQPLESKPSDVILFAKNRLGRDKSFNNQSGNKALFILASQHVNSEVTSPSKRLEAALSVFLSKNTGSEDAKEETEKPRFILCRTADDGQKIYSFVKPVDAAEVTLLFVFEVWLEKELAAKRDSLGVQTSDVVSHDDPKPSTDPIETPTPHDVLFGRGGMTNSHPGNKRFRDVIALHRPDYIKAIKNDKPNVARRIVRAIRTASPPGRFLKKNSDDGCWYDVGNRIAAEKASQALREKSNAEKRQRSAQREAMRTKREGGSDSGGPTKKSKNLVTDAAKGDIKGVKVDPNKDDLKTEGLPPNAVDKDGNILVTDWDILAGRGGLTNHHRGNKRFRDIVALHRPDYIRAPKVQKPSVARVIVRAIRNGDPPGRFLKKDEKTGKWYDIGDKKAAEKTSQALREKGHDKERPQTAHVAPDAKPPAFLLPAPVGAAGAPHPVPALQATDAGQPGTVAAVPEASVPVVAPKVEPVTETTAAPVPVATTEAPPAAVATDTAVAAPETAATAAAVDSTVPAETAANVPAPTAVVTATSEALNTAVVAATSVAADVTMTEAAPSQTQEATPPEARRK